MPRDGSGNYSLPAGNPVVTNDVISSTWANSTLADLQTQMTSSLDRSGRGGMLAPLRIADGTVGAPAFAFTSEPTSGFYRAGAGDIRWGLGGVDIARTVAAGFQFLRAAAWRAPLDVAVDAAITGAWTFAGVSVRNAALINAGTFDAARIPNLDASKITTGAFADARIPNLDMAKITTGSLPYSRLSDMAANVMLLTGAQTAEGTKTFNAFTWVTQAGSSGNNATRELLGFSDDRYDRYGAIGTWRGAASTRVGLSFFASNDAPAAEVMRINEAGNVSVLLGTFFVNSTLFANSTIELGNSTDTTLARIAAGRVSIEGSEIATYNRTNTFTVAQNIYRSTGGPLLRVENGAAALNEKRYYLNVGSDNLTLYSENDAGSVGQAGLIVRRGTGNTIAAIELFSQNILQLQTQVHSNPGNTTGAQVRHADGSLKDVGMNVMPSQTLDADLTFQRIDVGQILHKTSVTARTWTTPASTDTNVPIGSVINLQNAGSGAITVAAGAGVALSWYTGAAVTAGNRTLGIGGVATLYRHDANSWHIWGNGGLS